MRTARRPWSGTGWESDDDFNVTLAGFQKAARRALALQAQGDQEAARMLALDTSDPARWEYAVASRSMRSARRLTPQELNSCPSPTIVGESQHC